ncbi:ribonuclease T1 [Nocardioides exalbidus]|uniref:Ribonuclease T1 n=1 Tax=Nocardioides exalbidus TaxID=402596 RepID=A0A1H4ZRX8_9ACTN|nr:ribonuclease domain-containing protein [Nocardioides exalbidus]SED32889.1 ribonuclease T1 [Nocardioides exalbidus]
MAASVGRQRYRWLVLLVSAVLLVIWFLTPAGQDDPGTTSTGSGTSSDTSTDVPRDTSSTAPGSAEETTTFPETGPAGSEDPDSGLPIVRVDDLPAQVAETIALIAKGGPYPEGRDGITFENREGLLPDRPRGYYSEYTVATPGSDGRGARRVVAGDGGELYYTGDHYGSFSRIAS